MTTQPDAQLFGLLFPRQRFGPTEKWLSPQQKYDDESRAPSEQDASFPNPDPDFGEPEDMNDAGPGIMSLYDESVGVLSRQSRGVVTARRPPHRATYCKGRRTYRLHI